MKDVICIDLTQFNNEKLKEVAKTLNFSESALINNKKMGFAKIWILQYLVVAYTTKKDKNTIVFSNSFTDYIKSSKEFKFEPVVEKLSIDLILDKISKKGINSLTQIERDFLDNQS